MEVSRMHVWRTAVQLCKAVRNYHEYYVVIIRSTFFYIVRSR